METFIPAVVIFGIVVAGMAIGVIFGKHSIKGSCGGLGAMRDDLGQPMCECGAREGDSCASGERDAVFEPRVDLAEDAPAASSSHFEDSTIPSDAASLSGR